MKIAVISNEVLQQELLAQGAPSGIEITWLQEVVPAPGAAACLDLLFRPQPERIAQLQAMGSPLVIVNEVTRTLAGLPAGFARINGWPSFLKRTVTEAVAAEKDQAAVAAVLAAFHKSVEWVPDQPGMLTARVISMIINEAYFAWEEEVSTKEEIDTAMKLGTNYPYGPFEWGRIIGIPRVAELLHALAHNDPRYHPGAALEKEAAGVWH